jgi:hypothetical protein
MEKTPEFYNTWLESQKDFLDKLLSSQRELTDNWIEAMKKIGTMPGSQQGFTLFSLWFTTMLNSTKAFTEGITNLQNTWKTMIKQQIEVSKEITLKLLFDFYKHGGKTK